MLTAVFYVVGLIMIVIPMHTSALYHPEKEKHDSTAQEATLIWVMSVGMTLVQFLVVRIAFVLSKAFSTANQNEKMGQDTCIKIFRVYAVSSTAFALSVSVACGCMWYYLFFFGRGLHTSPYYIIPFIAATSTEQQFKDQAESIRLAYEATTCRQITRYYPPLPLRMP